MAISRRKTAIVVGIPVALVGMATPALAYEGQFSSYIEDALTGFNSRWWQDNNSTNDGTVVSFKGCVANNNSALPANAGIALNWQRPFFPDTEYHTSLDCKTQAGQDWGDRAAGNYRFELKLINGTDFGNSLDVDTVGVTW